MFWIFQESDRGEVSPFGLLGGGPQVAAGSVAIVPPTTGDDYESGGSSGESDEECRPMTAQELKNKIMKSVGFVLHKSVVSCKFRETVR